MTNVDCEESDGVRKVRLKTTSGVLKLSYRNSQSSREADDSPDRSSVEKLSQGGSQKSDVNQASGFGSLPELFELRDQFPIGEVSNGWTNSSLDLQSDFSTYNFWESESGRSLPHVGGLSSDTFSRCDLARMRNHLARPGLEPGAYGGQGPHAFQNCATEPDSNSQEILNSSAIGEMNMNRTSYWDFPLELEEDLDFECANYWNLLKDVTDERDTDAETMVDDFLVDRSPEFSQVVDNAENFDSNLSVVAPNRCLEDRSNFQSPADFEIRTSDLQTLRTIAGARIYDPRIERCEKRGSLRESDRRNDGQSMDIKSRNSDISASCIEESDVQDVPGKNPLSESTGDKVPVLRMHDYINHRRRRFSAPGVKRSKFLKQTTLTSFGKRSPNHVSPEIKPGRRMRNPDRKFASTRRLFKQGSSSEGESDHNCQKSPIGATPRRRSVPFDHEQAHVRDRAEISLVGSARSPFKEILEQSSNRVAPKLKLSFNACLLRKKRTRYSYDFQFPDSSNNAGAKLATESLSQDSPRKSKFAKADTRDSPAISQFRRSPEDSRKKIRTLRRRPLEGSPKTSHFYGKIIEGVPCQQSTPSPEQEGVSGAKSAVIRKGRRRLPLPLGSVEILQGWVHENLPDPYPSRKEKEDLSLQTGLKVSQVDNWLGNARQKLKSRAVKDLCRSESSSPPEIHRKRSKRKRSYPVKKQIWQSINSSL